MNDCDAQVLALQLLAVHWDGPRPDNEEDYGSESEEGVTWEFWCDGAITRNRTCYTKPLLGRRLLVLPHTDDRTHGTYVVVKEHNAFRLQTLYEALPENADALLALAKRWETDTEFLVTSFKKPFTLYERHQLRVTCDRVLPQLLAWHASRLAEEAPHQ